MHVFSIKEQGYINVMLGELGVDIPYYIMVCLQTLSIAQCTYSQDLEVKMFSRVKKFWQQLDTSERLMAGFTICLSLLGTTWVTGSDILPLMGFRVDLPMFARLLFSLVFTGILVAVILLFNIYQEKTTSCRGR